MGQKITFHLQLPLRLYQIEEAGEAEKQANKADGQVYTWRKACRLPTLSAWSSCPTTSPT